MSWNYFVVFAIVAVMLWITGALAAWKGKPMLVFGATIMGLVVFFSYIVLMWVALERPPLRTMGETRLWYSFFLPLTGIVVYSRWRYPWILSFSTVLATVFVCVNIFRPEIHSKTLMPALQSPWFAPHVIVYMFAYALFGAAFVMAAYLLFIRRKTLASKQEMDICDNLVYVGWAFLTIGMLFGALWANEAWGHYWAWGPERNVGCSHMAGIFGVHTLPTRYPTYQGSNGAMDAGCFLRAAANVLVGHQLSAVGTGSQRTYL